MKKIHWALTGLSFTLILLSINRLSGWTSFPLQPYDFLRLVDLNQTLIIPLLTVIFYYLLKQAVVDTSTKYQTLLNLLIICGIFIYGVGNGIHDVMNYLDHRFCASVSDAFCQIVRFNDDQFSNTIYYIGLICMNIALLWGEAINPQTIAISRKDTLLVLANALFVALAIVANLSRHSNLLHIAFFILFTLISLGFALLSQVKIGVRPVTIYLTTAYGLGTLLTLLYLVLQ